MITRMETRRIKATASSGARGRLAARRRHGSASRGVSVAASLVLGGMTFAALAAERFASTIGTVEREIPADRLEMTLEVTATAPTLEESVSRLDTLLEQLLAR